MNTYVLWAVGTATRHTEGRPWFIEEPLFASSVPEAEEIAAENGGDMALQRWTIHAESPERAMVKLADTVTGASCPVGVQQEMVEMSGVGGKGELQP